MNCGKCPHWHEIEAALHPCQTCDHAHLHQCGGLDPACGKCPYLKAIQTALKPCYNCEGGKLHGQVSIDAAADPNLVLAHRDALATIPRDRTSTISTLDPEAEEAVRHALMTVFDFTPMELMLIQHMMHGGTYASFNEPIRALVDQIVRTGYNLDDGQTSFRAIVSIWSQHIVEKYPPLKKFFKAAIDENSHTGKRIFRNVTAAGASGR